MSRLLCLLAVVELSCACATAPQALPELTLEEDGALRIRAEFPEGSVPEIMMCKNRLGKGGEVESFCVDIQTVKRYAREQNQVEDMRWTP